MPISAAERFQIAPTGRQQEAAQLGNPLVLVVFFWRGKCAKIINPPWNTTTGAQIEDLRPQSGLAIFFSGNKNMANRIYPAQLPAAASSRVLSAKPPSERALPETQHARLPGREPGPILRIMLDSKKAKNLID